MPLDHAVINRYLRAIGIGGSPHGFEGLCTLVRQHLVRVPFENISKLLLVAREGAGRPITLPEFLDGIDHHDFGGTCYSSNPFLTELLQALGYDAVLLGADMSAPNVHTSIRVRLGGREYHLDVGYAAPFSAPIPLDGLPHQISFGGRRYVFAAVVGGHEMAVYSDGERRHAYIVHGPPRPAAFFDPTIAASFERGRTFMRCLRITRFLENGSAIELRNRRLLRLSPETVTEHQIDSLQELRRVVNEQFIMPRCRVEEAVDVLERLNGRPFFGEERWLDSTEGPN